MIASITVSGFPHDTTYDHVLNMMKWQPGFLGLTYADTTACIRFESPWHASDAYIKFQSLPYSHGHWLTCKIVCDTSNGRNDAEYPICDTLFISNLRGVSGERDELDVLLRSQVGYVRMKYSKKSNGTSAIAQFHATQHAAFARPKLQGVVLSEGAVLRVRYSKNKSIPATAA